MPIEIIDQGLARMNPLKRVGVPADIGKAVSLLVSPDSEWINGMFIQSPICPRIWLTIFLSTGQVIRLSGGGI